MAAVSYYCPVDPQCPRSATAGFCLRHPTAKLERARAAFTPAPASEETPQEAGTGAKPAALCLRLLGESVTIPPEGAVIGREGPLFAELPGMAALHQVGRQHARLSYQGDALVVIDLGSLNGTFVNGRRVTGSEPLRPGDTLRLAQDVPVEVDHVRLDAYGLPE